MTDTHKHVARKRFGQHFLQDKHVIQMIIDAIHLVHDDHLVEIGPGFGALTTELVSLVSRMEAVEIDRDVIPQLNKLTLPLGNLTIHSADALKFDFCSLRRGEPLLRLVGNLPYNISTPLLFRLLEQRVCIEDMHFMLQKEVVDRLAAQPDTAAYGKLSVVMQYYFAVEQLFDIPPHAFSPPPKVMSSLVRLKPHTGPWQTVRDHAQFVNTVARAFAMRRKTLRNNFKPVMDDGHWQRAGIDPGRRAETLSLREFIQLTNYIDEHGLQTGPE